MSSRCMVAKVRLVVLAVGTLLLLTSTASAQHRDTFPGNDSFADALIRRHAVHRHRHPEQWHCWAQPNWPAQHASRADGHQQRLLSQADVELALRRIVGQSIR